MLEKINSLLDVESVLGTVCIDSMKVCTALGIRYLWIDSLCVVQDDETSKHSQIQNMDEIYAIAYVTLVAASEPKACGYHQLRGKESHEQSLSSDLSWVSLPTVSRAQTFVIDHVLYNCSTRDIGVALRADFHNSVWFSRGWYVLVRFRYSEALICFRNLQELALSRRILVFTASESFFYCSEGLLAESFCHGGDQYNSLSCESPNGIELCGALHRKLVTMAPTTISSAVREYNTVYLPLRNAYLKRVLTYDSDKLNAFSGIISALGNAHWGLPLHLFTRALLLPLEVFHPAQYIPSCPSSHHLPRQDKTVEGVGLLRRLPYFPSWSWVGWKSELDEAEISVRHMYLFGNNFRSLILIHVYSETLTLDLLSEPRDEHYGYYGEKEQKDTTRWLSRGTTTS